MSQENVEIVRRVYDAVARRESATVLSLYHPDIEWDFSRSPVEGLTGTTHYYGHEGLWRWWRDWGEAWTSYEDACEELIDAGEHVISVVNSQGQGRASGATVKYRQYGVWTIRDEQVVRVAWFGERDEALEAAGLQE
jgi:uncharacterized protein